MSTWYKKSQQLFRGDPEPISLEHYNPEYATKVLGRELGSSAAWGPGIYFTSAEDIAQIYGPNITRKTLHNARILTPQSPPFTYRQMDKMLQGVDHETMATAASNWDESYDRGRRTLIQSVVSSGNPLDQLMNVWADVFSHQNPKAFIELMVGNGVDGISITKRDSTGRDSTYYVIYNRSVLG